MRIGSEERPYRVAVVGAGPAGMYAAQALLKQRDLHVRVDLYERLPTPFGLVRYGVAPDHQRIKAVTRAYERTLADDRVRYFGNVSVGTDVTVQQLRDDYDDVCFTIGAATDRSLGVPGEDLKGSWSATEFVAWYNGQLGYQDRDFELGRVDTAVVIGVGNVAMDVARILARDPEELAPTDITRAANDALRASRVRRVEVFGRRNIAQAKFSTSEVKELAELNGVQVVVSPQCTKVDTVSAAWLAEQDDKSFGKNVEFLANLPPHDPDDPSRQVHLRFCRSPIEILGDEEGRVTGIVIERNEMVTSERGPRPKGTGETELVPCQAVFRAVGYRGVAIDGVPFDERGGVIPNRRGRVLTEPGGEPVGNLYTAGWIKRGPSGLIGTNKPDAVETVGEMLEALEGREAPADPEWADRVVTTLRSSAVALFDYEAWKRLDAHELERGETFGKVRAKATGLGEMLQVLGDD